MTVNIVLGDALKIDVSDGGMRSKYHMHILRSETPVLYMGFRYDMYLRLVFFCLVNGVWQVWPTQVRSDQAGPHPAVLVCLPTCGEGPPDH